MPKSLFKVGLSWNFEGKKYIHETYANVVAETADEAIRSALKLDKKGPSGQKLYPMSVVLVEEIDG